MMNFHRAANRRGGNLLKAATANNLLSKLPVTSYLICPIETYIRAYNISFINVSLLKVTHMFQNYSNILHLVLFVWMKCDEWVSSFIRVFVQSAYFLIVACSTVFYLFQTLTLKETYFKTAKTSNSACEDAQISADDVCIYNNKTY